MLFEKFDQKCTFSARASPSNLVYIGAQGALRKNFVPVGQNWRFEIVPSTKNSTKSAGGCNENPI